MSKEVCKIFIKFDNIFKNKEPDLKKINNINGPYIRSCPYDKVSATYKCNSNLEGIYVLCIHLFKELFNLPQGKRKRENNNNQYVEYIMMWLCYRLFQTKSYNSPTLIDFYNNHLMKSYLKYGYDDLIKKKDNLKDANLYYMSRFYQLFNEICHVILKHSNNNINAKEIKKDSVRLYNNYKSLYDYINECDSYLNLLNNLKTQHENLKNSLITNKRNRLYVSVISVNLKNLPHTRQANKISPLGFNCPKCKKVHSKIEEINPKSTPILPKSKSAGSSSRPQQLQKQAQQQKPEASPAKPAAPSEKSSTPTTTKLPSGSSPGPTTAIQKGSLDSQDLSKQENTLKSSDSDKHYTASDIGKQGGGILDKPEQPQDGKQQISSHKKGNLSSGAEHSDSLGNGDPKHPKNELEKQPSQSETKEPLPPEVSQQTQPHSVQPEPQNISESNKSQKEGSSHSNGQDASKIEPKSLGGENGNGNDGSKEPGTPSGEAGDPPSEPHVPSQDGKPDITNPLDKEGTSSTSGGSFGFESSFLGFLLNGTKFYNKMSQFIKDNHQKFKDAKDQINDVYNDAVNNLKSAYNASSIYFNGIINNIASQLNQDDTPKPGNSGDNSPQSNDKSQKSEDPLQLPPKDPEPNPASGSPEQKQSSYQSQSITQQPADVPVQVNQPNHKTVAQFVNSLSSNPILKKPWNIFPTTWNGSGDCKPEIKFMNATLVCCTSEQCSITGISITLVLIPIILLIVYKYLSSGWRKEMKRKKNMKKVVNSIGGKRPVQIIINESSQKKKIKKSINSVYGKKHPLLNIYKLMQADPVPFINLLFLLIFFVYKRKHNSLEV
ncbi:PIR protein CIR protein [Plasmodium vinckei lentum]|uniref:PIR protein CIR protein n=1 Tax=Plasmodium vinckei lentum TaxID=138297 RepID=A0A6V7SKJ0_PLAVN|nr:PIR protein CIR protein [Plasmodium vinckei lentum]